MTEDGHRDGGPGRLTGARDECADRLVRERRRRVRPGWCQHHYVLRTFDPVTANCAQERQSVLRMVVEIAVSLLQGLFARIS